MGGGRGARTNLPRGHYTTGQMAELLGLKIRIVIDWAEKGFIVADIKEADGEGSYRIYSEKALKKAKLAKTLIHDLGMKRRQAANVIKNLEKTDEGLVFSFGSGRLILTNTLSPG